MNEFIEKLIGRLEESRKTALNKVKLSIMIVCKHDLQEFVDICFEESKNIVNQLAEEYNNESVKGDLISRSLLLDCLSYYISHTDEKSGEHYAYERAKDLIEKQPKSYNDGWIPCSERLPEENEEVILTFKNSAGLHTGEATYKNKMFFYVTDTQFGYYEEVYKQPIAWKHKDAPYQPEGE